MPGMTEAHKKLKALSAFNYIGYMMSLVTLACGLLSNSVHAATVTWPNPATDREVYSSYSTTSEGGSLHSFQWGGLSIWDIPALGGQTITFCIEKTVGGWDTTYDVTPGLSTFFSAAQRSALDLLVTNTTPTFYSMVNTYHSSGSSTDLANLQNYSLAIQLAAWEISEETSSTLDLSYGAGSFYLAGSGFNNIAADTLAIGFINNISSGTWTAKGGYNLSYAYSPTKQDQLVITAVPEPMSTTLLLTGLGLIGWTVQRRRNKKQTFFSIAH